jgi:flagellar motor switch/type III secretory pathway protein FliN
LVRGFPWGSLETLSRREASELRALHRWAAATVVPSRWTGAVGDLLGARVDVRLRRVEPLVDSRPLHGGVGVVISPAGSPPTDAVLVEVDSALAGAVAARALRRAPPVVIGGAAPPAAVAGAVAAVIAAAARRSHVGVALQVQPASREPGARWDAAARDSDAVAVTLTVLLDDDAYVARIIARSGRLHSARPLPWNQSALSRLGAMPLALPVVAIAQTATVAEVEALGPGDVVLFRHSPGPADGSRRSPCGPLAIGEAGGLSGPVLLSPPGGSTGVRADLVAGRQLVVRGQEDPLHTEEGTMSEGTEVAGGWVGAVGEVPVVLRVEVGEAVLAAREWASLSPGDVIGLGKRVGDHVLLRVGGVPIARGELVDLDGEVGVRIVARLDEELTRR